MCYPVVAANGNRNVWVLMLKTKRGREYGWRGWPIQNLDQTVCDFAHKRDVSAHKLPKAALWDPRNRFFPWSDSNILISSLAVRRAFSPRYCRQHRSYVVSFLSSHTTWGVQTLSTTIIRNASLPVFSPLNVNALVICTKSLPMRSLHVILLMH